LEIKSSLIVKSMIKMLLILFVFIYSISGKSYYVSPNGNNDNNGSKNKPFKTIKNGVSFLEAGDTLVVLPGNYGYEYNIRLKKSGRDNSPIVVMAEKEGNVILNGPRKKDEMNCSEEYGDDMGKGVAFVIYNVSNVVIDGFKIGNYEVGITNIGYADTQKERPKNIVIKNCTFHNNGGDGIQNIRVSKTLVTNCIFISDEFKSGRGWDAIQDYGVNFYNSNDCVVENSYFYGEHNQALSFKEGDDNCIARKNIFEGVGHFAIFLGQERLSNETESNKNPTCKNLIAEYNIIRPTNGLNQIEPKRKYRTKTPIVIDNVENAIVRYNYIEGFDDGNKTCGINIYNEALGNIEIYNNIIAFSVENLMSGGIFQDWGFEKDNNVQIHNNTFYKLSTDFINLRHESGKIWHFTKNLAYKTQFYKSNTDLEYNTDNFRGDPEFKYGDPVQPEISSKPVKPDFDSYYKKLTNPFRLKQGSPAEGFGVEFK